MRKRLRMGLIGLTLAFLFVLSVNALIEFDQNVIFQSVVGGGNITFGLDSTALEITWIGDQVRFTNLTFDGVPWNNIIGFSAPINSTTMNVTLINATHIVIDTTQTENTTYGVYLNTGLGPTVTGADSSNYALPTLSYNMTANGTVTLSWDSPPDQAVTYILLDSYTEGNRTSDVGITAVYPGSVPGPVAGRGQTFNSSTEARIGRVVFYIARDGNPTGDLHAALYAHTGTFGVNGKPTGPILALSDPIDSATLGVGLTLVSFNFTGANRTRLEVNTTYSIGLQAMNGVLSAPNRVIMSRDAGGAHEGNAYYLDDGVWGPDAWDNIFYLYGIAQAPVNLDAETDGYLTINKEEWLNVTVRDYNGWENIQNVTVKVDTYGDAETFSFQWVENPDT